MSQEGGGGRGWGGRKYKPRGGLGVGGFNIHEPLGGGYPDSVEKIKIPDEFCMTRFTSRPNEIYFIFQRYDFFEAVPT